MSFFNRVNVALEELDEATLDSGEDIAADPDTQELDTVDTSDDVAVSEAEAEITADNESIDEAVEVSEELQEQAESNEEALENPEEVTEEQVEVAEECLKMNLARLGMVDMYKEASGQFKLAHESYSSPAERLQVAQEGIKETIAKIIEWIRNLFRKIMLWFKKMYAKLIVMFNRNLSRAKKVKEIVSKRNGGSIDADEYVALCVDHPVVGYWLADNSRERLNLDKDAKLVDDIKALVTAVNEAVSNGSNNKVHTLATNLITKAAGDSKTLTDLGAELDKFDAGNDNKTEGTAIITNPTSQKPKVLYIYQTDGEMIKDKDGNDTNKFNLGFEVQYQKVDLEQDTWESAIKGKANGIEKKWIQDRLGEIIKSAGKIKKFADNVFKTIDNGGKMANAFANLEKKVAKTQQGDMTSAGYTKAANIGRKLAGQAAVDVVIGSIRAQGVAISLLAACAKQLDNKKKN